MARVTGLNEVLRKLKDFGAKGEQMAKAVVSATANDIRNEAIRNAPANYGRLRQSITVVVLDDGYRNDIQVGVPYGAYVEWGTGTYVSVPAELQSLAITFKGKGKSGGKSGDFEDSDFFKAILDWVRKKGIAYGATFSVKTRRRTGNKNANAEADKQAAYVIAMSILKKGIKPQPYLYPAYLRYKGDFQKRLEAGVDRLVREANG